MKKEHKKIAIIIAIISGLVIGANHCANNNKYDNKNYTSTSISYSDSDYEKPFVTYEDLKIQKWYALQIEDETDPEKIDVIITRFTTFDRFPGGLTCYYYTNVFSEDYKVYRVFYNKEEDAISVETGPNIIAAFPLFDYVNEYGLDKDNGSYTEEEIIAIKKIIIEKIEKGRKINKKDNVLIYERHHY